MNKSDYDEVPPSTYLADSVRNFGYNFNSAICDIVDNSISAGSSEIRIRVEWNKGQPFISITDNGCGMSEKELANNIVVGSANPREMRSISDLGRFGLGLKTASFSMCRELSVFSKTEKTKITFRGWDLDVVQEQQKWLVSKQFPDWYDKLPSQIKVEKHGTLVLWKKCDRFLGIANDQKRLREVGVELISYIGAYFYRFLTGAERVNITVNNTRVTGWSPIVAKARSLVEQRLNNIKVHPYILPQKKDFDDLQTFEAAGGLRGWNAQQGFYVYRNGRLVVNGGWLGFKKMKKDEHTKLARIIVDLDSSTDMDWGIDVSKSKVTVPSGPVRDFLEHIARRTRKEAENVYRTRGKVVSRTIAAPEKFVWLTEKTINGETLFRINKKHPAIERLLDKYGGARKELNYVFSLIEKLVPAESMQIAANNGTLCKPDVAFEEILDLAKHSMSLQEGLGKSRKNSFRDLVSHEPFHEFREQLAMELGVNE